METTIANKPPRGKPATRQEKNYVWVIVGCQRVVMEMTDVLALARNGIGYIRETTGLRLVWSEGWEQGFVS